MEYAPTKPDPILPAIQRDPKSFHCAPDVVYPLNVEKPCCAQQEIEQWP